MLASVAGYARCCTDIEFSQFLEKYTTRFSEASGIKKEDIYWQEVTDSDWCNSMIILLARVPSDWEPTKDTHVIGASYDPNGHLSIDIASWIRGRGCAVDHTKHPAKNPHSLYHTQIWGWS